MIDDIKILEQYLSLNSIIPNGHLVEDIKNQNYDALSYVIYAVKNYPHNVKLKKKVELVASKRGDDNDDNDIRRNYENQLVEFHALYILTEKMKYNFIDFDIPSNKQYAKKDTNCDILLEKNGKQYFVDAKQSSAQLMSYSPNPKYNLIDINKPVFPNMLGKYILDFIGDGEEKGCDFLILQVPKWGLPSLNMQDLSDFLKKVSPDIIYQDRKWYWSIRNTHITKLIFLKGFEYWEIDILSG